MEKRWFIYQGKHPYTGGNVFTRTQAIREHLCDLYGGVRQQVFSRGGLTPIEKKWWAECRSRGDRAVRATLVEVPNE